jgi:uncharacterized protein YydD (DUF2326 family)
MTTKADIIKVSTIELKRATLDYEERRALWSQALKLFSEFLESLYKAAGRLVIDIDDTGYKFDACNCYCRRQQLSFPCTPGHS